MKKHLLLFTACILLGSCSTGDAALSSLMKGNSSQALTFINCRAVSGDVIEFEFSQPVKITSLYFDPVLNVASVEDGSTVKVKLEGETEPGALLTADLLAEDAKKNTINVLVTLRSRNDRMPQLVINELRTEYSRSVTTAGTTIRVEFIEFKMKTAGNLGAMRVFFAGGSQKPSVYEFAPVEVKKDEYVVLHLRKMEEDCRDEYGINLNESGGTDASPTGRDFWIDGTVKLINKTACFIYVLDQDDRVLDAVMLSEKPDSWWTKDYLAQAAEFLYSKGAWTSEAGNICTPADAVRSSGTSATRTICRDETAEKTGSAAAWYITDTSCATPGKENDPKRYSN